MWGLYRLNSASSFANAILSVVGPPKQPICAAPDALMKTGTMLGSYVGAWADRATPNVTAPTILANVAGIILFRSRRAMRRRYAHITLEYIARHRQSIHDTSGDFFGAVAPEYRKSPLPPARAKPPPKQTELPQSRSWPKHVAMRSYQAPPSDLRTRRGVFRTAARKTECCTLPALKGCWAAVRPDRAVCR